MPLRSYCQLFPATEFPTAPAVGVGHGLANLHRAFRGRVGEPALAWLADDAPWIMQVHEPSLDHLVNITVGNHKLLQIMQSQPGLSARLNRLRPQWQADTLIHGDVKSDNILFVMAGTDERNGGAPPRESVRLIDCELVHDGVGLADDQGDGRSFGQARCAMIAQGLWSAFAAGVEGLDDRVAFLRAAFRDHGLDPDRPHLHPGFQDCEVSLKGAAGTAVSEARR